MDGLHVILSGIMMPPGYQRWASVKSCYKQTSLLNHPTVERDWKITINTIKAAKGCDVLLVVYGQNGSSGPILIGRANDEAMLFRDNSTDVFMVSHAVRMLCWGCSSIYSVRLCELMELKTDKPHIFSHVSLK